MEFGKYWVKVTFFIIFARLHTYVLKVSTDVLYVLMYLVHPLWVNHIFHEINEYWKQLLM